MAGSVILAVAGSGKTSLVVDEICEDSSCLIVSYTDNNCRNIQDRIIQKLGCIPPRVKVTTYFSFLFSFCYRPILGHKVRARGLDWNSDLPDRGIFRKEQKGYYFKSGWLYPARLAKLILETDDAIDEVFERVGDYFENVFIDEVQDFAANDFNFLCALGGSDLNVTAVGDFYQHTYDTSRDGNTQGKLYDDYEKYQAKLAEARFEIDAERLGSSFRCSPTICEFVTRELGIAIDSARTDGTQIEFIDDAAAAVDLIEDKDIVKLTYRDSAKYDCHSMNWGASKGLDDFEDVVVVLNDTTLKHHKSGDLRSLKPISRNRLYVALTRSRRNVYLIPQKLLKPYKGTRQTRITVSG